ncbi:MAG: type III pantothenate kinase [Acidimicrobiia bacterium]|nr:type III pantothenate kinase [Acidimicrobiia bacterium]MDH5293665.1 type III pantothenate kinase [Acidimicrobiia bacterium]
MLLVADIGNSTSGFGLYDQHDLIRQWRITTASRTADEYELVLEGLLAGDAPAITGAAMASVVPAVTEVLRATLERISPTEVVVVGPGVRTGLNVSVDNPREVGADRIANAVGAIDRYGAPVVTVDFGTATTVDLVGGSGAYLGGAIAPGPRIGGDALVEATSALRRVELAVPRHAVGKSTVEAIQSGLLFGTAGAVDTLVDRFRAEHSVSDDSPVVATGGMSRLISPLCRTITVVDDDLTLWGLKVIHARNSI